eukprot:CAMPEP_0184676468 /NCGR_PEP_ID=MMETSP0308-20130426/88368_1 /TAXON_ID=38269 /ORGANISM="Gloeochaete witrockiana, Strain SAG 46.84" /LENGTH=146 /DNA_ID=CAMNT_0027124305 /DNA_START=79 /DNA_END=522 /DNA_ORIENTATION=-
MSVTAQPQFVTSPAQRRRLNLEHADRDLANLEMEVATAFRDRSFIERTVKRNSILIRPEWRLRLQRIQHMLVDYGNGRSSLFMAERENHVLARAKVLAEVLDGEEQRRPRDAATEARLAEIASGGMSLARAGLQSTILELAKEHSK